MKVKVHVSQDHIERGACSDDACPIALALGDSGLDIARVYPDHASWEDLQAGTYFRAWLPESAKRFVRTFDMADEDDPPKPITFELEAEAAD